MVGHPLLVDRRERRDRARGARELAHIARAEQHARISAAAAFVDIDELLLHVRQLGQSLEFEVGESIGGLPQRVLLQRPPSAPLPASLARL